MRAEVGIPAPVLALAGGEAVRPVWVNELGGIAPDPDRTSYYRLLWDLGP